MLDYLIKGALVCTGTLEKANIMDVGIKEDRIVLFDSESDRPAAKHVVDGHGMILTPGFIDPHASTGFGYFFPNAADHKLYQGITTEIFGNCGTSPGPVGPYLEQTMHRLSQEIGFPYDWSSLEEYFQRIESKLQFNIATLVGHSTLRAGFMEDWKTLTEEQHVNMCEALEESMDQGALGMSTGLIYAPGCFAEMEEIVDLAKIVSKHKGVYASHIRDERNEIDQAVEEALTICKRAQIKTLISHLKAAEHQNWGKIPSILRRLESFNEENPDLPVSVDVYPYTAISTKLRAFIPKYILQDGIDKVAAKLQDEKVVQDIANWIVERDYHLDQMMIISDEFEAFYGKTVEEIGQELEMGMAETIAHILMKSTETWIVYHCINQEDIDAAILWDRAMICTDSWSYPINAPKAIGQPHPRSYGAFTAYLERYVKDLGALSWEEAIHKITYMPAAFFNLEDRGHIAQGKIADLVLLDPLKVKANATYKNPRQLSSGVQYLWVNGSLVIENEIIESEVNSGRVLKLRKGERTNA